MINIKMALGLIALITIPLLLNGCAVFKYLDDSTEPEILSYCTGENINALGETTAMERRRLEIEQRARMQIDRESSKLHDLEEKYSYKQTSMQNKIIALEDDISKLKQKLSQSRAENLELKTARIQSRLQSISSKTNFDIAPANRKMKIKVLSGNNSLLPALNLSKKLKHMGYNVKHTDIAPSTAFSTDKVFYKKGFASEARELAKTISPSAIFTPLSWNSKYDIIVVTRNPDYKK